MYLYPNLSPNIPDCNMNYKQSSKSDEYLPVKGVTNTTERGKTPKMKLISPSDNPLLDICRAKNGRTMYSANVKRLKPAFSQKTPLLILKFIVFSSDQEVDCNSVFRLLCCNHLSLIISILEIVIS